MRHRAHARGCCPPPSELRTWTYATAGCAKSRVAAPSTSPPSTRSRATSQRPAPYPSRVSGSARSGSGMPSGAPNGAAGRVHEDRAGRRVGIEIGERVVREQQAFEGRGDGYRSEGGCHRTRLMSWCALNTEQTGIERRPDSCERRHRVSRRPCPVRSFQGSTGRTAQSTRLAAVALGHRAAA